jgi:hypothetical protein
MSAWIDQIFNSKIAKRGGVARRKLSSIDKNTTRAELKRECKAKGFRIIEHGDQWLIFCDPNVKLIG